MMKNILKTYSPIIGFVAPPVLYLLFFAMGSVAFSALGLSAENMLLGVVVISVIVWSWSLVAGRSQYKFLKKRDLGGNFKDTFGINSIAVCSQIIIWLFVNVFTGNMWESLAFILILMLVVGSCIRVFLSNLILSLETSTSLNSLKVVLIEDVLIYGLLIFFALTMGGTFL